MPDNETLSVPSFKYTVDSVEIAYDFSDSTRFRKITVPEQMGITADSLLSLVPSTVASNVLAKSYVLRFPKGLKGQLMNLHQGGQATTMMDASNHIIGTASLYKVDSISVTAFQIFSIASLATGQYFLSDISSSLKEINKNLQDVLEFLEESRRAELMSEFTFTKYASTNYEVIMLNEQQRIATITNLQRSKIKAIENMEFYNTMLQKYGNQKLSDKETQNLMNTKRHIDFASQLYVLSAIMEVYYTQNWNTTYLKNVKDDANGILKLSKNRLSSSITSYANKIRNEHKEVKGILGKPLNFLKGSIPEDQLAVLQLESALVSQEDPPLCKTIENALDSVNAQIELYLNPADGTLYQRL